MPPKAGKKTGKTPVTSDLPPGTPLCLKVSIAVRLKQDSVEGSLEPPGGYHFRYTFVNGENVVLTSVGTEGLWQADEPTVSNAARLWRTSKRHQLGAGEEMQAAKQLNENPYISIVLVSGAGERLASWPFDLSCFLSPAHSKKGIELESQIQAGEVEEDNGNRPRRLSVLANALPIDYLKIDFSTDSTAPPLFSPNLISTLNPLAIEVAAVLDLPADLPIDGSNSDSKSSLYAVCHPPPCISQRPLITSRLVVTGSRVNFQHTSVYLIGEGSTPLGYSRSDVYEWLQTGSIHVELHGHKPEEPPGSRPPSVPSSDVLSASTANGASAVQNEGDISRLTNYIEAAGSLGNVYPHGTATFKVSPLLGKTSIKMRQDVCPCKPRLPPEGDGANVVIPVPTVPYFDYGTALNVTLSVAVPFDKDTSSTRISIGNSSPLQPKFSRAVYVFEYCNDTMVEAIAKSMDEINSISLQSTLNGSLRVYHFSKEEISAAENGALDVVCGFMLIDEDCRLVVVEGLADGGLRKLIDNVGRAGPNCDTYRVLADTHVRFLHRLYTSFNADLKRIRVRDALPVLCRSPEVYNRVKVSEGCFQALDCLRHLRGAKRLKGAKNESLFPEPRYLIEIENKYGESVNLQDIMGGSGASLAKARLEMLAPSSDLQVEVGEEEHPEVTSPQELSQNGSHGKKIPQPKRKADTDSSNAAFLMSLRSRVVTDFLEQQRRELEVARSQFEESRIARNAELAAETVPTQWCYGPQKLNYTELKKAELRTRLAKQRDATFTYSKDFVSQTVSLVDEFRIKLDEETRAKEKWVTKRGFIYPAPKSPSEYAVHPKKPSESRIDILKEVWVENELHPKPGGSVGGLLPGQCDFDSVPSNGGMIFGGLQPPKYDREFDGTVFADRSGRRLPRGRQTLTSDPEYFKSVHLCDASTSALAAEEAKRKAHELWQSKVVVDDTAFYVGGYNKSNKESPSQVDRQNDILSGPAIKKSLKIVRNVHLPSGKKVPFPHPPISIFTWAGENNNNEQHGDMPSSKLKFMAELEASRPQGREEFTTTVHADRLKPKSQSIVAGRRKILPIRVEEVKGPKWMSAAGTTA